MSGFLIWAAVGAALILLGIRARFSKKPVGFWANAKTLKTNDVKGYNRATGNLFIIYGVVYILLGIPLLTAQNELLILLSGFGVAFETIIIMSVYTIHIEKKFDARNNYNQSKSSEAVLHQNEEISKEY